LAKGFGSGIPIGGFVSHPEIAADYTVTDAFATFGGNPLSCAAAVAVIEIIQEEKYLDKAAKLGALLRKRMEELKGTHKIIGEVRGQGMMLGIELVRNQVTKEPAAQELLKIMEVCREKGLLIGKGGLDNNVIRLQPPLELTEEQIDQACVILDDAFSEAEKDL